MEEREVVAVGWSGPGSAEAVPVLKPEIVEELLARLGRGEKVKRLAAEYGVDRKTIRAWRARGRYQPRVRRPRKSMLDAHAPWLTARAPEVDFNSAVLYRELVTHFDYAGSAQQVLRSAPMSGIVRLYRQVVNLHRLNDGRDVHDRRAILSGFAWSR